MQERNQDRMRELEEWNNFLSHKKKNIFLFKDLKSAVILWVCSHLEDIPQTIQKPTCKKYSMQNYLNEMNLLLPTLEHTHKHKHTHTSTHLCICDINNHSYTD